MTAAVERRGGRLFAAMVLGGAVGATTSAGNALLLYTGQGFLRAAGLLLASSILALAAGVWAGAPDEHELTPRSRGRWLAFVVSLLLGGAFTMLWNLREGLRAAPLGGATAVLLILAVPSYTAGAVLAALHARRAAPRNASLAAAALVGGALGVLATTMLLIQNLEPYSIYYSAAVLTLLLGLSESRASHAAMDTPMDMKGKVALITGVGDPGQLGYSLAQTFLNAGARVVITSRAANLEELAAELAPAGSIAAVHADLTSDDDIARIIGTVRDRFGRLDACINAAGGLSVSASLAETTPEQWHAEMQRNAETVLRVSRAVLPLLRESRGAIVNFASPAGTRAVANLGAYSAAKAAVIALTRALALEEKAHGVRVNAIAPGFLDTAQNRQTATGRTTFVSREDVAWVALFLASPAAAAVSGETVPALGPTL